MKVEVRGQLARVSSILPTCRSQALDSVCQTWVAAVFAPFSQCGVWYGWGLAFLLLLLGVWVCVCFGWFCFETWLICVALGGLELIAHLCRRLKVCNTVPGSAFCFEVSFDSGVQEFIVVVT